MRDLTVDDEEGGKPAGASCTAKCLARGCCHKKTWTLARYSLSRERHHKALAPGARDLMPLAMTTSSVVASGNNKAVAPTNQNETPVSLAINQPSSAPTSSWPSNRRRSSRASKSIDGLVALDSRLDFIRQRKASAELGSQFISALDKSVNAHAVDELHGTAGPGRKANAEDRADVGIMHAGEDVLVQTTGRLHRLAIEQAVFQVGDVPLDVWLLKQGFELWPEKFFDAFL